MANNFPKDQLEFHELMLEVDRDLVSRGIAISGRPIMALGELSTKFGLPLPISKPRLNFFHESFQYWPISARVYEWYDQRYGERLKVNFSPGKMVILIEDDLWSMKFPRIFGAVSIVVSRTVESSNKKTPDQSPVYNVVDSIENLPRSRVIALSDGELHLIYEKFLLGFEALSLLNGSASNQLIQSAKADITMAAEHLMSQVPQFGLSKWASLQATEKALKAAIASTGRSFSTTHNLEKLTSEAKSAGLVDQWSILLPHIQCSPGIRYGEERCDRDAAVIAHHASLAVVLLLQQGGAAFESEMRVQPFR